MMAARLVPILVRRAEFLVVATGGVGAGPIILTPPGILLIPGVVERHDFLQ
jgi:hypothetical protein